MTVFEIISANKSLFELLSKNDIDVNDCKYIEVYLNYKRLVKEGHKKAYIVQYLSDLYGISTRTIYRIEQRFDKTVNV